MQVYVRGKGTLYSKDVTDYKGIKDTIDTERSFYEESGFVQNVLNSYFKVKNNKVVKIAYCAM